MKYKVGDRVRIKSLDWYYDNRDRIDEVECGNTNFIPDMVKYCGGIATISAVLPTLEVYHIKEDGGMFNWTDEMIEGLVEEETLIEKVDDNGLPFNEWLSHKGAFHVPNGYEIKDENGNVINATKIVLEKKKKEYPKTYEECCKVLGFINVDLCFNTDYRSFDTSKEQWKRLGLMNQFYQLLNCRDAYWKIAGEKMGLDGPWKPKDLSGYCTYAIIRNIGHIGKSRPFADSVLLEFPTEEMRDAFYENFKELIEQCEEML